jgi:hypothetical protein
LPSMRFVATVVAIPLDDELESFDEPPPPLLPHAARTIAAARAAAGTSTRFMS